MPAMMLNPGATLGALNVMTLCCRRIYEGLPEDVKARVSFFNSFFWTKLNEKAPPGGSQGSASSSSKAERSFARVKRWTRVCSGVCLDQGLASAVLYPRSDMAKAISS